MSMPSKEAMAEARKFCPRGSAESEVASMAYLLDAFAEKAVAAERERIMEAMRTPIIMNGVQGSIGNATHAERKRIFAIVRGESK